MSELIQTSKNGQQYETIFNGRMKVPVHYCRTCALKMHEANKGFDYRCAKCHEKAEGWC